MQEIVDSIQRVTDIMSEITAAVAEQTSGIEQINQAITQMDQVTQQNAALVEEAAAASEAMQEQAGKLAQVVAVFQLDGAQLQAAASASRSVTPKAVATSGARPRTIPATPKQAAPAKRLAAAQGSSNDEWEQF